MRIIIITIMTILLQMAIINAADYYRYERKLIDSHVIHILQVDHDKYTAEIVKANHGSIGRETVSSMASRFSADIAINAGFFEIGSDKDGAPAGTLVINGKTYNVQKGIQPLIVIKDGIISINQATATKYRQHNFSLISGIPMLINHGKISEELFHKKSEFYIEPHARTALGLDSAGRVVIVVAEHHYKKDMTTITVGEVQSLMKTKRAIFTKKYKKQSTEDITLNELKQILRDEFAPINSSTQGLTILELAKLMQDLGCKYAINLDGGGSSTLCINGQVVNNTFGDKDENIGKKLERSVSDAIIFRKRKTVNKH